MTDESKPKKVGAEPGYSILLDHLAELIRKRGGSNLPTNDLYRNDAQVLSIKLFTHLFSVRQLSDGANYIFADETGFEFIDSLSMAVIVRSAIESYLVFHYLFGNEAEDINRFRHACWAYGGLKDRQRYTTRNWESVKTMLQEAVEADLVRGRIQSSPLFLRHSAKQQRQLLEGNWQVVKEETSWHALAASAGINAKYFSDTYAYLSSFSHSTYASSIHIRATQGDTVAQKKAAEVTMSMACLVLMMLIRDLTNYLPVKNDVSQSEGVEEWMHAWHRFGEFLHANYESRPMQSPPNQFSNSPAVGGAKKSS